MGNVGGMPEEGRWGQEREGRGGYLRLDGRSGMGREVERLLKDVKGM